MLVSIILPLFTYRMGDRHPCRAVRGMVKWRHNRIQKGRGIEDGFYKKDAAGLTYQEACAALRRVIGNEARRFGCLLKSELLDAGDKDMYRALTDIKTADLLWPMKFSWTASARCRSFWQSTMAKK